MPNIEAIAIFEKQMIDYLKSLQERDSQAELKPEVSQSEPVEQPAPKVVMEPPKPEEKKRAPSPKPKTKKAWEFATAEAAPEKLEVCPMAYPHDQLKAKLNDFYKKLQTGVLKSNHTVEYVLEKMSEGYHGHYLYLCHEGVVYGMACLNYDQSVAGSFRAYIRQLSTINPTLMPQALDKILEYIWAKMPCEHVRVELLHIKDEETGKTAADPDIKNCYSGKGFRWKTLTNDPVTGRRAQIMQLVNPGENKTI